MLALGVSPRDRLSPFLLSWETSDWGRLPPIPMNGQRRTHTRARRRPGYPNSRETHAAVATASRKIVKNSRTCASVITNGGITRIT